MKRKSVYVILLTAVLGCILLAPIFGMVYAIAATPAENSISATPAEIGVLTTSNNTSATEEEKSDSQSIVITLVTSLFSGIVAGLLALFAQKKEKQREILLKSAYEWYKQIKANYLDEDLLREYFNNTNKEEKFKEEYAKSAVTWEDAEFTLRTDFCCNRILNSIAPEKLYQYCICSTVEESQTSIKLYVRSKYQKLLKSIMS